LLENGSIPTSIFWHKNDQLGNGTGVEKGFFLKRPGKLKTAPPAPVVGADDFDAVR
jgi:hypothetical protein